MTDQNTSKTNHLVTLLKSLITGIFLFAKSKITIAFNKTLSDNFEKVYETTLQMNLQNLMKKSGKDSTFFATVGQMSLCFTEVIIFSGLSLISYFADINVFYVIFILSIGSTLGIDRLLQSSNFK